MRLALALTLLASTAAAQSLTETPLSGDKLETLTLDQSYIVWRDGGEPYGITVFHPNRTVTWHAYGDGCVTGTWTEPSPGLICFTYPETNPCWHYFANGTSLRLHFNGDPDQLYFYGPPGPVTSPCGAPALS